jgi:hypothetical protein
MTWSLPLVGIALVVAATAAAEDCNQNGVEDSVEISARFATEELVDTGILGYPRMPRAGDWDGDGVQDLALRGTGDRGGELRTLRGLREGGFETAQRLNTPEDAPIYGLASGDVDGDGDEDLQVALPGLAGAHIIIYENQGTGVFQEGRSITTPIRFPQHFVACDLDSDGDQDFIVTNDELDTPPGLVFLLNDGAGLLSIARPTIFDDLTRIEEVIPVDLDGDARVDLVLVSTEKGRIAVSRNRGSGIFETPIQYRPMVESLTIVHVGVAAADLDGDARPEIIVPRGSELEFPILWNDGHGEFTRQSLAHSGAPVLQVRAFLDGAGAPTSFAALVPGGVLIYRGGEGIATPERSYSTSVWNETASLAAVDATGDGLEDLLVLGDRSPVLLRQLGVKGQFSGVPALTAGIRPQRVVAGDIDGDGNPDIVAASATSKELWVYWGGSAGAFRGVRVEPYDPKLFLSSHLEVKDVDGDGAMDLLAAGVAYLGSGGQELTRSDEWLSYRDAENVTVDDLDGDSIADLAVNLSRRISLYRWQGTRWETKQVISLDYTPDDVPAVDLDGDGSLELVVRFRDHARIFKSSATWKYEEVGSATFKLWLIDRRSLRSDLDGDGREDLISIIMGGDLHVLWGGDDLNALESVSFPVGGLAASSGTLVDIDADGDVDIVVPLNSKGTSVIRNDRNRNLVPVQRLYPAGSVVDVAAADFDSNGRPDLALLSGVVSVLYAMSPFSPDGDGNGIPDGCEGRASFRRGDGDGSGSLGVNDALVTLRFLFSDGSKLVCLEAADADNSGSIEITDALVTLQYLYLGGPPPASPGPPPAPCGPDPDRPGTPSDLGCDFYGC